MSILDQLAERRTRNSFRPTTVRELFLLRLAQKLSDVLAVQHYADLCRGHSDETLLVAYRRTMNHGHPPRDLGRRFHEELGRAREQLDHPSPCERLLAIKVERRCVAAAVFVGLRMDFHDRRYLSSDPRKAETSALGFIEWVIRNFDIQSAALERTAEDDDVRRGVLSRAVLSTLRSEVLPVWEIGRRELLAGFAHPALRSRADLQNAAQTILWSMFNSEQPDRAEIDAAALGLYVQVERLFLH